MKNKTLMKTLSAILTVVMVLCSAPLSGFTGIELPDLFSIKAEALMEGNFYYSVSDNKATLSGCVDATGDLVIPSTLGGYPVTRIGDNALRGSVFTSITIGDSVTSIGEGVFEGCTSLEKVTIGNSVTSIGNYAFCGCTSLVSVTIPDSVKSIGGFAFSECESLTSVTLGDGVESINVYAFSSTSIKSITIPDSVTNLGIAAFFNCLYLETVTIGKGVTNEIEYAFVENPSITEFNVVQKNENYSSDSYGVLYNKSKTELIKYPTGNIRESFVIPEGVVNIYEPAFGYCSSLKSVVIPDSVTSIDNRAFYYCENLEVVTIGEGVISIGEEAFSNCSSLASVIIPENVESIGENAFYCCKSLAQVYYTGDIESWCGIEFGNYCANPMDYANNFYIDNTLVKEIVIPDTVTEIKYYAFYSFEGITSVTIPDSVTSIGYYAFRDCTSLTSVTIGNSVTSIGDWAFGCCVNLTSVMIPDSVTKIGEYAFHSCENLESVVLGKGVTSIGDGAFGYCVSLTLITVPDSVEKIGGYAFYSCKNLESVAIGKGVTYIGSRVFDYSENISLFLYSGTREEWKKISIDPNNTVLTNNKIFYETTSVEAKSENGVRYLVADMNAVVISCDDEVSQVIISEKVNGKPVTSIESRAFSGNAKITSVVIPDSVTSIEKFTFYKCENLTDVYYNGTKQQWENITIGSYNTELTNATIHFLGEHDHEYIDEITQSPTCTKEGEITYTCSVCGDVYAEKVPALSHTESAPVEENRVNAVCISQGSCDIVVYCAECKEEISRETIVIPALGHIASDPVEENRVEANCVKEGSYDTIVYCVTCSAELSRETTVIPALGHTESAPVEENRVNANCIKRGSYDTVVYCSVCKAELSRVTTVIPTTGHTKLTPVAENRVEPTCVENGSYDSVVYCSVCKTELSRETKPIPAKGHTWGNWVVVNEPTITSAGLKVRMCKVCTDAVDSTSIPATGITVTVIDADGKVIKEEIISGDLKEFSLDGITDGEYTLKVSKDTYVARTYTVTAADNMMSLDFSLNKIGDMNGDGKVNTLDVARANAHAKGMSTLSGYDLACVDVNGDGKVNTVDVAKMNAHAKGVTTLW